ncbi:unnamed protein product, partial [Heterosigma akashiwo]
MDLTHLLENEDPNGFDTAVQVGNRTFVLHSLILTANSSYFQALGKHGWRDSAKVCIPELPGGEKVFECLVKFCYGGDLKLSTETIIAVRSAASYLGISKAIEKSQNFLQQILEVPDECLKAVSFAAVNLSAPEIESEDGEVGLCLKAA